jgi:RNA polymerase sigma factor (sigma-70 family)
LRSTTCLTPPIDRRPSLNVMHGSHLIEALAREHGAHLRWLAARHRGALTPEVLEEVLQEAYAKAIAALGKTPAPTFPNHDAARGWLRQIAHRTAVDAIRARDGRRPGSRPRTVELDDADAHATDPEGEAEESVLGEAGRDHDAHVIARAIGELPDHYQRILRWRYRHGMEPQAIARLERISARSYEGQHRRAMAALRAAVAGLDLGAGCGETRRHLRRRLGGLLEPSARQARVHVETCMPCLAFERRLRGALALAPLSPTAVAMELLIRPAAGAAPAAKATAGAAHGSTWAKVLAGAAASTVAVAGATAAIAAGGAQPPSTPTALGEARAGRDLHTLPRHSAKLFLKSRVGSARDVR